MLDVNTQGFKQDHHLSTHSCTHTFPSKWHGLPTTTVHGKQEIKPQVLLHREGSLGYTGEMLLPLVAPQATLWQIQPDDTSEGGTQGGPRNGTHKMPGATSNISPQGYL